MLFDDAPPQKKPELLFRNLSTLSAQALKEYTCELKAEMARVEAELLQRGSARDKAEALFKNGGSD